MSYDQKQIAAVLVTCQTCGKSFYMTSGRVICLACRQEPEKA